MHRGITLAFCDSGIGMREMKLVVRPPVDLKSGANLKQIAWYLQDDRVKWARQPK